MTHYATLGVDQTATPEQLKSAFRQLAKKHHPDLGGDPEKFKQLNEAYDILNDTEKRAHYDFQLSHSHQPYSFVFENHFDAGSVFNQFQEVFGHTARRQVRNRNIRVVLDMDLLDTLHDQVKLLDIRLSRSQESLEVHVPAGIEHDTVLSAIGHGDNEHLNLARGNLEIVIKIRPHARFYRQNENLVTDVTIDCFSAVIGTDIELDTPTGKKISMRIPAGTQNGSVFGVPDEGFPANSKNVKGKLLIRINILIPKNLTPDQMILVKEIQKKQPVNS
jgi:curved DNA-binding protein